MLAVNFGHSGSLGLGVGVKTSPVLQSSGETGGSGSFRVSWG